MNRRLWAGTDDIRRFDFGRPGSDIEERNHQAIRRSATSSSIRSSETPRASFAGMSASAGSSRTTTAPRPDGQVTPEVVVVPISRAAEPWPRDNDDSDSTSDTGVQVRVTPFRRRRVPHGGRETIAFRKLSHPPSPERRHALGVAGRAAHRTGARRDLSSLAKRGHAFRPKEDVPGQDRPATVAPRPLRPPRCGLKPKSAPCRRERENLHQLTTPPPETR